MHHSKVLLEHVDKKTYKCEQVLEANGIWAVFYNDKPINIRSSHYLANDTGIKYKKTSFSNPGHAINLCKKLNTKYKTTSFTVVFLEIGQKVYEDAAVAIKT